MKRRIALLAVAAALIVSAFALCACSSQVTVKVVDSAVTKTAGGGAAESVINTAYTYNDKGQLTQTAQSVGANADNVNLTKQAFTYNDKGQLTQVDYSSKLLNWGLAYTDTFEYGMSNTNFCTVYGEEVKSQGAGSSSTMYTMGDAGLPSEAFTGIALPGSEESVSQVVLFEYLSSGHISTVISEYEYLNIALVPGQTDEEAGNYMYLMGDGSYTMLSFDKNGQLISEQHANGNIVTTTTYTYKELKVDKGKFVPNIYTNPQGFTARTMPSLSKAVAEKIMSAK